MQAPQQPMPQQNQPVQCEERRSSHANGETCQRREHSSQGLVSANTRRNKATSGQHVVASQRIGQNRIAVRIHRTGVDPRVEVPRSHLPESNRTIGCPKNTRTGNNQENSTTGNVFNRLGRGADMRDTLNRRCEQERSQHSIAIFSNDLNHFFAPLLRVTANTLHLAKSNTMRNFIRSLK